MEQVRGKKGYQKGDEADVAETSVAAADEVKNLDQKCLRTCRALKIPSSMCRLFLVLFSEE